MPLLAKSRCDLARIEKFIDHLGELVRGDEDLAEVRDELLGMTICGLLAEHLRVADDGCDRGGELLSHIGEPNDVRPLAVALCGTHLRSRDAIEANGP